MTSVDAEDEIRMLGLGSCIGVFLVVPGLFATAAHVLLPQHREGDRAAPGKYADTAVPYLIERVVAAGVSRRLVKALVVGGAQVFKFGGSRPELEIGNRNAAEVKAQLVAHRIPIVYEDVGGDRARTVGVAVATGAVR